MSWVQSAFSQENIYFMFIEVSAVSAALFIIINLLYNIKCQKKKKKTLVLYY